MVCKAILGCFVVSARNCLASMLNYIVMQMRKINREKCYCESNHTFFFSCWSACQTWQSCPVLEYKRWHWKVAITRGLGGNYTCLFLIVQLSSSYTVCAITPEGIAVSKEMFGWDSNLKTGKLQGKNEKKKLQLNLWFLSSVTSFAKYYIHVSKSNHYMYIWNLLYY